MPRMAAVPPLMKALLERDSEKVRVALEEDPEAAKLPFFEHHIEPPLCCAVRAGCNSKILGVLLDHEADVNMTDVHGRSPLALLCSLASRANRIATAQQWMSPAATIMSVDEILAIRKEEEEARSLSNAIRLLDAGADMHLPDVQGMTAEKLAMTSGNARLASLMKYYHGTQACITLKRAAQQSPSSTAAGQMSIGQLTEGPICTICTFLAPEPLKETLSRGACLSVAAQ